MLRARRWFCGASLLIAAVTLAPHVRAIQAEPEDAPRESREGSRPTRAPSAAQRTPAANMMTPDEWRFLELINRERATRRMPALKPDTVLVEVAREHSREMCDKSYFDHVSPTAGLRTPMDRYLRVVRRRPPHACVGENLFYCSVVDVDRGHRAFMNSPGHRANILYAPFRRGGVGIYKNDAGEFWVTEMFLSTEG